MQSFKLTDIETKSMVQMNNISQISEYDWKNLNIVRLNPSKTYETGDTEISFQLDSSLLGSNVPMNRIEMIIDYEVIVSSTADGINPASYTLGNGYLEAFDTASAGIITPYICSLSNSGLDFLVGNKTFSNVRVKNGANELRDDKRSVEKIDIMSRMLDQSKMEKWGVYPDYIKGVYSDKAGGDLELIPLNRIQFTNANPVILPIYARGCDPKDALETIFWKRNTNEQYIKSLSLDNASYVPVQYSLGGGAFVNAEPAPYVFNNVPTYPNALPIANELQYWAPIDMYQTNPSEGTREWYYWVVPDSSYRQVAIQQKMKFQVTEDLLGDIFTTRYNRDENARPLPSSLLNFTFTIAPDATVNSLFKSSAPHIQSVQVQVTKMSLNIFTFNWGLLNIIPSTYYVPFYQEQSFLQTNELNATGTTEIPLQTLKYNKMPPYIMIYTGQNVTTNKWNNQNLNTIDIEELTLTIDNDQGTALFQQTIRELKERSLKNFGEQWSNYVATFRSNTALQCGGLRSARDAWETANFAWDLNQVDFQRISQQVSTFPSQSWMDSVLFLKVGRDIRIEPSMIPSLNRPVSLNFKLKVGRGFIQDSNLSVNTNVVAFHPAYYILDPHEGLIKFQDFSIKEEEFWMRLENTNSMLRSMGERGNEVQFTSEHPQMMLGSGWFGNLFQGIKSAIPVISSASKAVSGIASQINHPTAQKIASATGNVSRGADLFNTVAQVASGKRAKKAPVKRTIKKRQ